MAASIMKMRINSGGSSSAKASGVAARQQSSWGERLWVAFDQTWRPAILLLAIGVLWWVATEFGWVASYLVPSPGATWETMISNAGYLWDNTLVTMYETLIGFGLAVAFGLLAAVIMVYSSTMEKTFYPILLFAQVVPKIAVAPLFIVWLGFGMPSKILVAVLIAFFPVVISGVAGLRAVDPEMLQLAATMDASPRQTFMKIRFPTALPHIFSGLKVAATMAVTGAVVGEFVGSNAGLGFVIQQATGFLDTAMLFSGLIIMSVLGVVLFGLIELADRLLLPWHASRRKNTTTSAF